LESNCQTKRARLLSAGIKYSQIKYGNTLKEDEMTDYKKRGWFLFISFAFVWLVAIMIGMATSGQIIGTVRTNDIPLIVAFILTPFFMLAIWKLAPKEGGIWPN